MKEKAAVRRLQQAEEHLKAVEQKSGRAMRAIGRRSSAHVQKTVQRPLAVDSSSHESSEVNVSTVKLLSLLPINFVNGFKTGAETNVQISPKCVLGINQGDIDWMRL